MNTSMEEQRAAALAFLKTEELGVLATSTPEDGPSARPLYYAADDDFNVFFTTLKNTRKVADILKSGRAAFTIYDRKKPAVLEIHGTIADCTESAVIGPVITELAHRISAKGDHFAPLTRLDSSVARFFKLTPTWIRYGDFSAGTGTDEVFTEIVPRKG